MSSRRPTRAIALDAVGAVVTVALVVVAAGILLYAVDAVPAWVTGEPRHVRHVRTVEEVERRLRTRLFLPYYFPSTLVWPPQRIRFTVGPPGAAAMVVADRSGVPRLFVAETVAPGPIPDRLLPEAQVLSTSPVAVGKTGGTLSRVVEEGTMAWQVAWEQGGRSLLVRSRGTVDELLRIARSVREEQ